MNVRLLVLLGVAVIAAWSFRRWRDAVRLAMVLLILEGAIRKWLFPGAQDLVYFAKDVVLLAAYGGFLGERRRLRQRIRPPQILTLVLVLGAAVGLLQVLNPRLPSLLVGVLGFKSYFLYVPLLVVVPAAFASDADLARFLRRYALIAIPVGLLAIAQFFSPSDSFLNTYARGGVERVTTFGSASYVRVTGTFSYITGYSAYLLSTALLILGLLATTGWKYRGQTKIYAALAMTLLGMLMTGSRGPVFSLALVFPFYWLLTVMRERESGATIARFALGMAIIAAFVSYSAPEAVEAFRGRAAASTDMLGRMTMPLRSPLASLEEGGLLGVGIGSTHQAASALVTNFAPNRSLLGAPVEAESGKVMLELGPLGFLLVYFPRVYLILFAFREVLRLKVRFHRMIATPSFLFFLAQLPGSVVFDPIAGVYYWFFAGLLMLAIRLDREAVAAAARPAAGEARPGPAIVLLPPRRPAATPRRPAARRW